MQLQQPVKCLQIPLITDAPAGLPHDNDTIFCPDPNPGGSCYFYYNQLSTYAEAQATCRATYGGFLLSYEAEWEQRLIERRFTVGGSDVM